MPRELCAWPRGGKEGRGKVPMILGEAQRPAGSMEWECHGRLRKRILPSSGRKQGQRWKESHLSKKISSPSVTPTLDQTSQRSTRPPEPHRCHSCVSGGSLQSLYFVLCSLPFHPPPFFLHPSIFLLLHAMQPSIFILTGVI